MKPLRLLSLLLSLSILSACGGGDGDENPAPTQPVVIVAFGDSLTEGSVFVTPGQRWVDKMARQIQADGVDAKASITVINQGVGGETAIRALARLPGVLATHRPTHIFLAHGTNDIWWDCPGCFARTQQALQQMVDLAKASGAKVILTDITFRLRGEAQAQAFSAMYTQTAQATNSTYLPIVADVPFNSINYHADLLHLKDAAQEAMKSNAIRALYPTLR